MTNGWAKWGVRLEIDFCQGSFDAIAGSVNWRSRIQVFERQRYRIAHLSKRGAILRNNASIDSNPGTDDANGQDGKTIAAARFNQQFFEGTLGWNFDTVWRWDTANNRPTLRPSAGAAQPTAAASTTPMQDLLTRQVQANIWL